MSFDVTAEAYQRFMGRFSEPLAERFVAVIGLDGHERALDVGAGPGAVTGRLLARLDRGAVCAVDPSPSFVQAARQRFPAVDVRIGTAEHLPWPAATFDVAVAQLVVHFMSDPVAGLREMGRVTRPGGRVAASVWDHAGGGSPLTTFWRAVRDLDPTAAGESELPGAREGHLAELCTAAGLEAAESSSLRVSVAFSGFEDWWEPYTLGVGPAGAYVNRLDPAGQERLRAHCADTLPSGPLEVPAAAWCVLARVPSQTEPQLSTSTSP